MVIWYAQLFADNVSNQAFFYLQAISVRYLMSTSFVVTRSKGSRSFHLSLFKETDLFGGSAHIQVTSPLAKVFFLKPQLVLHFLVTSVTEGDTMLVCVFHGLWYFFVLSTPANCISFDLGPLPILGWRFPRCHSVTCWGRLPVFVEPRLVCDEDDGPGVAGIGDPGLDCLEFEWPSLPDDDIEDGLDYDLRVWDWQGRAPHL